MISLRGLCKGVTPLILLMVIGCPLPAPKESKPQKPTPAKTVLDSGTLVDTSDSGPSPTHDAGALLDTSMDSGSPWISDAGTPAFFLDAGHAPSDAGLICEACPSGYLRQDSSSCDCVDVNECLGPHLCAQNCLNIAGGYECTCAVGTTLNPDGLACDENSTLAEGLIAHYLFEQNVSDETDQHHGSLHGDHQYVEENSEGNYALQLQGNAHVDIGSFDVEGSGLTLALWVRASHFDNGDLRFLSKSFGAPEQEHIFMLSEREEELRVRIRAGGVTDTLVGGVLPVDDWAHIAATYDSNNGLIRLFINGDETALAYHSIGGDITQDPTRPVWIGASPDGSHYFTGLLDDVRIYRRPLQGSELLELSTPGNASELDAGQEVDVVQDAGGETFVLEDAGNNEPVINDAGGETSVLEDAGNSEPVINDAGDFPPFTGDCELEANVSPTPIRRLSLREYRQTIFDITGVVLEDTLFIPGDGKVEGFYNHTLSSTPSITHLDGFMREAEKISAQIEQYKDRYLSCDPSVTEESVCRDQFISQFGFQCFRRPVTDEEKSLFVGLFNTARNEVDFMEALQWIVEAFLQSPQFLYRIEIYPDTDETPMAVNDYHMASRLSYLVWGSVPDEILYEAVAADQLRNAAQIEGQARRMLEDPKAKRNINNFYDQWLEMDEEFPQRDPEMFPFFNEELYADMREETSQFLEYIYWEEGFTFDQLLLAPFTVANANIAAHYGLSGSSGDNWEKLPLDPERYAGILTQPSLLTHFAHSNQTSPVLRGIFIREQFMCQKLPAPPDLVNTSLPEPGVHLGTRERLARHQEDPACASCHHLTDPIGFAFENFDPTGQWRETEGNEIPISASGTIIGLAPQSDGDFHGVVELADKLSSSEPVQDCFVGNWVRFSNGRSTRESDRCGSQSLQAHFQATGLNLKELYVGLTQLPGFRYYKSPDVGDGDPNSNDGGPLTEVSTENVYEALHPHCMACHPGYFSTLSNFQANLVENESLVSPGNAEDSALYHRLLGSMGYNNMPPQQAFSQISGTGITMEQIAEWIDNLGQGGDNGPVLAPFASSSSVDCDESASCPAAPTMPQHAIWHNRLTESPLITWTPNSGSNIAFYEISVENTSAADISFDDYIVPSNANSFQAINLWLKDTDILVVHLRAVNDDGVASEIVTSQGWTVDIRNPDAPMVDDTSITVDGQLRWGGNDGDEGSGFSHYEYALGTQQGADDIIPWTNADLTHNVALDVGDLEFGYWYFASVRAVDVAGNMTTASGIGVTVCPENYVFVPADFTPGINTFPFCVAQFEMKLQGDDNGENACVCTEWSNSANPYCKSTSCQGSVAESRASGTPWSWLMHAAADLACSAPDVTYRAIMNDEWQTIARNIEANPENWSGGVVGSGYINQGHSDNEPSDGLDVNDIENPCDGTNNNNCTDKAHSDFSQKRTHTLSNGSILWDFSGNVSERVGNSPGIVTDEYSTWQQYTGGLFTSHDDHETHRVKYGPAGPYNKDQRIGAFYVGTGELTRGGYYSLNTNYGGIYAAHHKSWNPTTLTGFRCTYAP